MEYNVRFYLENIVIEIVFISILFGCYTYKKPNISLRANKIIFAFEN